MRVETIIIGCSWIKLSDHCSFTWSWSSVPPQICIFLLPSSQCRSQKSEHYGGPRNWDVRQFLRLCVSYIQTLSSHCWPVWVMASAPGLRKRKQVDQLWQLWHTEFATMLGCFNKSKHQKLYFGFEAMERVGITRQSGQQIDKTVGLSEIKESIFPCMTFNTYTNTWS